VHLSASLKDKIGEFPACRMHLPEQAAFLFRSQKNRLSSRRMSWKVELAVYGG